MKRVSEQEKETNLNEEATKEQDIKETTEEQTEKEEKKADKKKAKADKKHEKLQEKVDELEDRVKRQMAEFENFRKRTDKEKAAMFETGAKSVIEKILPVVDIVCKTIQLLSHIHTC